MDVRELVGRNVRRLRLANGLTQEQFAERSGFSQQYLSDLERGRRNPTIVTIYELSLALGVDHVMLVAADTQGRSGRRDPRPQEKMKRGKQTRRE